MQRGLWLPLSQFEREVWVNGESGHSSHNFRSNVMVNAVGIKSAVIGCIAIGCLSLQTVGQAQNSVVTGSTVGEQSAAATIAPPVTYFGVLPCASCEGRRFTLSLRPDGLFLLRQVYLSKEKGKDKTLVEQGTWHRSKDEGRIILWGGIDLERQFTIRDANTLRMLDDRGREIQSTLNYDLVRSKTFDPIEDPFRKRWMYVRNVDRAFAIDCIKGMRFPVAQERDVAALEAAYAKAQPAENAPLVVEFEGHFARRPKIQGAGEEDVVVVDKFLQARSGEGCTGSLTVGGLDDSYWKLVELNGEAVVTLPGQQEPHLRLESVLRKVTVSGGCSSIRGSYQVNQGNLRFKEMADTQKNCPETVMQQESALLKALEAATTFRLFSEALELYGQGKRLARFEKQQEQK
jgi:copper homeostasis protein (lipoprotein)